MIMISFLFGALIGSAIAGVCVARSWGEYHSRHIDSIRSQFEEAKRRGDIKEFVRFPDSSRIP